MSVELQIIEVPAISRGWTGNITCKLKNSGTENVTEVHLKVIDAVIYSALRIHAPSGEENCLNVFSGSIIETDYSSKNFPAGTERTIFFDTYNIKADAPIDVHNVSTHFQYEVY